MSELARIDACAKRPIDIWTNYLYYPLSIRLVYMVRHWRWVTPNTLTLFALALCLLGCVGFASGERATLWWGLLAVQLSYVLDCADGQLARYRQQFSSIGGWLDQVADRVKEFAIYFSLADGYTHYHPGSDAWMWAMTSLFALYLLEYCGQIVMFRKPSSKEALPTVAHSRVHSDTDVSVGESSSAQRDSARREWTSADSGWFMRLRRWRTYIPFRAFIIGEQYFALLVFLLLDAVHAFLIFTALLGLAMCVYRPAVEYFKFRHVSTLKVPEEG
jgi:archaetidylinositol phosphate synthase